jgi:Calcineurin-like phosphoesterase
MPGRTLQNYVGLTRQGSANNHYSIQACQGIQKKPAVSMLNKVQEFFSNDFFGWLIHDWRVKPPFKYPAIHNSIHDILKPEDSGIVTIGVAADWATDTVQSEFIGKSIKDKNPDYTVHLGDTYFSGDPDEMKANYWSGESNEGLWPRGRSGSFTLIGNHEMFSSGSAYIEMIRDPTKKFGIRSPGTEIFTGQEAPCFCLRTDHWMILGLDTGYQSLKTGILRFNPNNNNLNLPDSVANWIRDNVLTDGNKRGIIVLTHHQYVTAFHGESEFTNPALQLRKLFPDSKGILWIWGHEHRFSMYGKNEISAKHIPAYGRCIGNGGMPDEHTSGRFVIDSEAKNRKLVLYDKRTADSIPLSDGIGSKMQDVGFNGYAMIQLDKEKAQITYYASYKKNIESDPGRDNPVFRESWISDGINGQIIFDKAEDLTSDNDPENRISWFGATDPVLVSQ